MNPTNAIVETTLLAAMAVGLAAIAPAQQPASAILLTDSAATTLAAALVIQSRADRSVRSLLRLAFCAALIAMALAAWQTALGRPGTILALGVGVAALTVFTGAIAHAASLKSPTMACWLPVTLLVVAAALPFWAAAIAGTVGPNVLVGISPLSYLAAMADYDFLRSPFGYRHSLISGLRYDYPDPGIYTLCLAVFTVGLTAATRRRTARPITDRSPEGAPEKCH